MAADVAATLVADTCSDDAPPGSYEFYVDGAGKTVGMIYVCPCGCGKRGSLPFRPDASPPSWEWDGNENAPTLSPSVHHVLNLSQGGTKTHWHGWLQGGIWRSC